MNFFVRWCWLLTFAGITTNSFSQQNIVSIKSNRHQDNSVSFYYEKSVPGTYTVKVEFSQLTNAYTQDFEGTINSTSGFLFKINPIDNKQGISFAVSSVAYEGNLNPKVDSLFVYTLPFQKGKIVNTYETNNLYHDILNAALPENWKAYQFKVENADTIYSARKGLVVKIADHFETDTISLYNSKKNYITVEHADGTYATYTGFAKKKILVKLGQTIYPQTPIGIIKESFKPLPNDFSFMVYYFNKDKSKRVSGSSDVRPTIKHVFLTPYFYTDQGTLKLEHFEKYQVAVDPNILVKELTKSEKKKLTQPK